MKIIEDSINNEEKIVSHLVRFSEVTKNILEQVKPFSEIANGRTLPRFIAETSQAMQKLLIPDFGLEFPALQLMITNGELTNGASQRLHDACFKFGNVQKELQAANCVLKFDDQRERLTGLLLDVLSDIAVYTITQFSLYKKNGEVELGVHKVCEFMGVTPEVFYASLMQQHEETGRDIYAYEVISPVYQDMLDADPVFTAECEENFYPLTEEIARRIIHVEITSAEARYLMTDGKDEADEEEVDVTPSSLITRMRLDF